MQRCQGGTLGQAKESLQPPPEAPFSKRFQLTSADESRKQLLLIASLPSVSRASERMCALSRISSNRKKKNRRQGAKTPKRSESPQCVNRSHRLKPRELCYLYLEPAAVYTKTSPSPHHHHPESNNKAGRLPGNGCEGRRE